MEKNISIEEVISHDMKEYTNLSGMLSRTVHDINNPLAVFIGQLSIIEILQERDKLTPEKLEKIMKRFQASAKGFEKHIQFLKNYYKVLLNDSHFKNFDNAITSVFYYFENQAAQSGINLELECDESFELEIKNNELFLITKHLIQNAIESLKSQDKEAGKIVISCKKIKTLLVVSISDTGLGLSCPLSEACDTDYTTQKNKESGLGLAIVQNLLRKNSLELSYSHGEKAVFSVEYPILNA